MPVETLKWSGDSLVILDQRLLPVKEEYVALKTVTQVCEAIRTLAVRGAPAIGVAAGYGVVLAAREKSDITFIRESIVKLRKTRPTAVNLFYALQIMENALDEALEHDDPAELLLERAQRIYQDDQRVCRTLSAHGAELLSDGDTVLTHCNAGGLATSGYGTALGVIYSAVERGKRIRVYADETRPLLQGGRLTAWELRKNNIPVTVITDSMAAEVLRQGRINHVLVGADRIAANGDTANKIGTYGLSVLAREHGVPFSVAAPLSSFDFRIRKGSLIPIEERDSEEIYRLWDPEGGQKGIMYYNPSFDVTPAANITAIISEQGIAGPPLTETLAEWRDPWLSLYSPLNHARENLK